MAKKAEGKERKFVVHMYNSVSNTRFSQELTVVKESEIAGIVKSKYFFTTIEKIEAL